MTLTYKHKRTKRADDKEIKSPSIQVTLWGIGRDMNSWLYYNLGLI